MSNRTQFPSLVQRVVLRHLDRKSTLSLQAKVLFVASIENQTRRLERGAVLSEVERIERRFQTGPTCCAQVLGTLVQESLTEDQTRRNVSGNRRE